VLGRGVEMGVGGHFNQRIPATPCTSWRYERSQDSRSTNIFYPFCPMELDVVIRDHDNSRTESQKNKQTQTIKSNSSFVYTYI